MTTETSNMVKLDASLLTSLTDREILSAMQFTLPFLTNQRYRHICTWLFMQVSGEWNRRTADDPAAIEPGMITVPDWSPNEAAQALTFLTCQSYSDMQPGLARLTDELVSHMTAMVSCMLDEYQTLLSKQDKP